MSNRAPLLLIIACCLAIYIASFVVVHRSSTLRRPTYNMLYWYYSDNDAVEAIEFYGFWPLRQITYVLFPNSMSEHIRERRWPKAIIRPDFEG